MAPWLVLNFVLFTCHGAIAYIAIYDLMFTSRRKGKIGWLVLIALVPFAGAYCYRRTRKRKRKNYFF
ncbi:MAG: PLDc N-terminal domain-containing protein [Bacteroidota bacterium]